MLSQQEMAGQTKYIIKYLCTLLTRAWGCVNKHLNSA